MQPDTNDLRRIAKLRFLAEAAIAALSNASAEANTTQESLPSDASEDMLRTLLHHAVPVLRASIHRQLADQIEATLSGDGSS